MKTNETKEHIGLLNVRLMHSVDTLIDTYNEGYEFFKEKNPDDGVDDYYAAVHCGLAKDVISKYERGGGTEVAVSAPIIVAVATIKYLAEHPEFKSNLMF